MPLLLLPGTLCDDRVFAPMLAHLRLQLPDLRAQVIGIDSFGSVTAAVQEVLRHAPEQFALLGFSLGGVVALHIAAQASERVRGLALLSSTALPVPELQHETRRAQAAEALRSGLRAYMEQHMWPQYASATSRNDSKLQELLVEMAVSLGIDALHRQTELALTRPDARALLPRLAMPVLVLAGEEDQLCPPEAQRALAETLPSATLALIASAGHFAVMEKPDIVAAHVAAWFHRLRSR